MSILVTGGAGYLGSHVCLRLLEEGYDVVAFDNFCNSSRTALARVSEMAGETFRLYQGDVRNGNQLIEIITQNDVDAIIHLAALKSVPESFTRPLEYYENNVGGTLTLLRVMAMTGVPHLVFSSSAAVYGDNCCPAREDDPLAPTSPYGRSKMTCERMIADYAAVNEDFSAVVLRYFNPIGAHPSGQIGEAPKGAPGNLFPRLLKAAAKGEKLTVTGGDFATPDGTGQRDYLHVLDLADGHLAALEALERRPAGVLTCNLGGGRGVSVLELLTAFEQATGVRIPYEIAARREGDLAASWAEIDHAAKELGWKPARDLEEACRDGWAFQQENPDGYPAE